MAETSYDAAAYSASGAQRERVALPAPLFDGTVNMPVMHQAVKAYLANQRQGNAATKVRKYVIGGNQKPWKQKGTGRARQGSIRAPQWVGGGTVFGPHPRSYAQYVPRQVRALARKSAFNARAREGAIFVVDALDWDAPKTSRMVSLLTALGVAGQKVLFLTDGAKPGVYLSGRNIPSVKVLPYSDVSAYHILWSNAVVLEAPLVGGERSVVAEAEADARAEGDEAGDTGEGEVSTEPARPAARRRGARAETASRTGTAAAGGTAVKAGTRVATKPKRAAAKSAARTVRAAGKAEKRDARVPTKKAARKAVKRATKRATKSATKSAAKSAAKSARKSAAKKSAGRSAGKSAAKTTKRRKAEE
ncbi:MAG: 50S ribosomal protein L4 [Gemmatimonadaceae bacterium]